MSSKPTTFIGTRPAIAIVRIGALALALGAAQPLQAATIWDAENSTGWWYDPVNWNANSNDNITLPNTGLQAGQATEINMGYDAAGEGVVFDPASDPSFTGAGDAVDPFNLQRLYLANGTTDPDNRLTIKSGTLQTSSYIIVGRNSPSTNTIVQQGGNFIVGGVAPTDSPRMELGRAVGAVGVYEYHGGTLSVAPGSGYGTDAIRLGAGSGGVGRFISYNDGPAGAILAENYLMAYSSGSIAYNEFHYGNGGVRPIQVEHQFSFRNDGADPATRSTRLELVLDEAPTVDGSGVPQDLALFVLGDGALITGIGEASDNPRRFYNADASALYDQGDVVSAVFGNTQYNWTISYEGDVTFSDPVNSLISSISGVGGQDVMLLGLSSESIASFVLGDFNRDDNLTNTDIQAMLDALVDLEGYKTTHGLSDEDLVAIGDINGDSNVTNTDIQALLDLLTGGDVQSVPEPATAGLLLAAVGLLAARRRR